MAGGETEAERLLEAASAELDRAGIVPEYLELRSAADLVPVERLAGETLLCLAARVGPARLIDNVVLRPATEPALHTRPLTGAAT